MSLARTLALYLDPSRILDAQGMTPDPWQRELLLGRDRAVLLNCSRQAGKSTTVAALALHELLVRPRSLVLLASPTERQSRELYRKVLVALRAARAPVTALRETATELELDNGSRLIALPGREGTIRSYSGVRLLILDEASRVPDVLYRAVRPMLAVSQGRLVALSTPFGQRGWFYEEWIGTGAFRRVHIPWTKCPRISADFIAEETRALGPAWVDQEYNGRFTTLEGQVYPEFEDAVTADVPEPGPNAWHIGGIDFGWRNPFAAVWGFVQAGMLWITHEHYRSRSTVEEHAKVLPRHVDWIADPAGAAEMAQLRRWDFHVRPGRNEIREGIMRVIARIRTGTLKIHPRCEQLRQEARLYRYPTPSERAIAGENPVDEHNHALAALRYLISRIETPRRPDPV
jgi:hypothetical protein